MKHFTDPPASDQVLDTLIQKIIRPAFSSTNSTVVAFPGSGRTSELRYLVRNIANIPGYSGQLFTFLDLETLYENEDKAFREMLSYLTSGFSDQIPSNILLKIEGHSPLLNMKLDHVLEIFHDLSYKDGKRLHIFIDNSYKCYEGNKKSRELSELILALRKVNPMNISFTFIASKEFNEAAVEFLGRLSQIFIQNILWGKDVAFDKESALCAISNQEKWNKYEFSPEFKDKAVSLSSGDPSLLRLFLTKAMNAPDFETAFTTADTAGVYELVGKEALDERFRKILKNLSAGSLECLAGGYRHPTDFLTKTGLLVNGAPMNEILDHFVKNNKDNILKLMDAFPAADSSLKELLSGQELLVYKLLEEHPNEITSRDAIAKAMWGDDWEAQYSDWAIDQLLSRLRAKLKKQDIKHTLKSVKGKGLMFI